MTDPQDPHSSSPLPSPPTREAGERFTAEDLELWAVDAETRIIWGYGSVPPIYAEMLRYAASLQRQQDQAEALASREKPAISMSVDGHENIANVMEALQAAGYQVVPPSSHEEPLQAFTERLVQSQEDLPADAARVLREHLPELYITPPCPRCVSERGHADPACPACGGSGVCPSDASTREESAERTIASIAAMLGWENIPPRETLEREISVLKARASRADPASSDGYEHDLRYEWWMNHGCDGIGRYSDDGEMQCCLLDFKRQAIAGLRVAVQSSRWRRLQTLTPASSEGLSREVVMVEEVVDGERRFRNSASSEGWQDIATAPKDGTWIRVKIPQTGLDAYAYDVRRVSWGQSRRHGLQWCSAGTWYANATHWSPSLGSGQLSIIMQGNAVSLHTHTPDGDDRQAGAPAARIGRNGRSLSPLPCARTPRERRSTDS